jgi:cytochrome c biogenesis protein
VLIVAVASLLGVVFPQAADPLRLNPDAYDAFEQTQRARYGVLAGPMRTLGLFEVFHTVWFNGLFFLLLTSVVVCTYNRFAPTWRSVRHPLRSVNDRYFERAHARAVSEGPLALSDVEEALRSHRFKVERVAERDGAVYLFADRYSWVALATFASHLSLILFMAGGIISKLVGFETFISVGEGMTQPVFPVVRPNQMQVLNLDSVEGKDAQGRIVDYHTDLVVYRHGQELCRGTTTVNGPLNCAGYRFHQASFAPDGVKLRVREVATGALVYNEAPILSREPAAPSPRVVVKDAAGTTLFDGFLVLAPLDDRRSLEWIPLGPNNRPLLATAYRTTDTEPWRLSFVHLRDRSNPEDKDFQVTLSEGQSETTGGYQISFPEIKGIPALVAQGIPGIAPVAFLQLTYEDDGTPLLDLQNLAQRDAATSRLVLQPGEPVVAGEYEYTFEGVREYTGILVKRDPGSWFIWIATALLIGGLAVTFYVPRRRLWLKVAPERTYAAGIAERTAHLSTELGRLLKSAEGIGSRQ